MPEYPIYIISKGRWQSRKTANALEKGNINYKIVIEPQEYEQYASVINTEKILILPFSNLGQGGIPARNWVWEHSIGAGAKKHWILDDNIQNFYIMKNSKRIIFNDNKIFKYCEDFVDRYENIALSGMNYENFVVPVKKGAKMMPPLYLNTRVYSCILIKNDISFRWRGRYNEDTDLSLRALKGGWCTVLFNAFMADKTATMLMKGGNTDQLYQDDGRLLMAKSLQEQHPDVTKIVWRWHRWQHYVNYKPFKSNKLIKKII